MYSVHRCFQLICRWLIRSLVYFPPWLPSILDSGLAWNLISWKAHGAFKLSIWMLWFPIEYMHWLPYLLCAQLDKVHQTFLSNPCSACISRVVFQAQVLHSAPWALPSLPHSKTWAHSLTHHRCLPHLPSALQFSWKHHCQNLKLRQQLCVTHAISFKMTWLCSQ